MLLVLVGNATSSTSLVTEQEGLTWCMRATRMYAHIYATTELVSARTHTLYVARGVSRDDIVPRIKVVKVRCDILRSVQFRRSRNDEINLKIDRFRKSKDDSVGSFASRCLTAFFIVYNARTLDVIIILSQPWMTIDYVHVLQ